MIYINREAVTSFVELDNELDPEINEIGNSWDDYLSGRWVPLSEVQARFHIDHPDATAEECWRMELTPAAPEPEEPERDPVDEARERKMLDILRHDQSPEVNGFTVNGRPAWLTPDVRANYKNSVEAAALLGESRITFIIAGIVATATLDEARVMLARIQRYADQCTIVTERHKAAVSALTNGEEIEDYDHTAGYPERESFTVTPITREEAEP